MKATNQVIINKETLRLILITWAFIYLQKDQNYKLYLLLNQKNSR